LLKNRFTRNDTAVRLQASAERNTFSRNEFQQNWSDIVESGSGGDTVWSHEGVGNRWSSYTGFDFDGDGIGESAHPILRPFERIEGANDLARLYLQSPAAAALDLVARSAVRFGASADAHPLVSKKTPGAFLWLSALLAAAMFLKKGRVQFSRG
jgi:nitrous oxidase accessory protein